MNPYLNLQTKLLVLQFGKKQVMEALANIEGVEIRAIERELAACRGKKEATKTRRRKTVAELVDQVGVSADLRPALERVAHAYQNRRFLPSLSEVRNFLGERGVDPSKLRSRASALPKVISVLTQESAEGLERLLTSTSHDRGDLGILADHILGGPKRSTGLSADRSSASQ